MTKRKRQRVRIRVLIASDRSYCAAGYGTKGEHEKKEFDWLSDGFDHAGSPPPYREVWVEADVPLPEAPVKGRVESTELDEIKKAAESLLAELTAGAMEQSEGSVNAAKKLGTLL